MDPRDYAVLTLDDKRLPGLPRQAFKRRSPVAPDDPRDRALAEALVTAVVKNLRLLETLVSGYAQRPITQIDARCRLILAVAVAQFKLFDRVPDHALVMEAVRQTRRLGEPGLAKAAGFVNAALRRAVRDAGDVEEKLPPRGDARAYCEIVLSHPRPLVDRLFDLLGEADVVRFCEHDNATPPTLVRLIGDATIGQLDGETTTATPHNQPGIAVVTSAKAADFKRWSAAGVAQPQDATSAAVVPLLGVEPGMTVLDRCCGVGTKTQQLSEAAGEAGRAFAVDALGSRVSLLRRLAGERPSMANVTAKRAEWAAQFPEDWPKQFDRILIDAPCGNSGVMARRAEARYAQSPDSLADLPPLQAKILADTWPLVAPGGRLAYATCSVWPEENGRIIADFLAATPDAEAVEERAWLPSFATRDPVQYRDGGYVAVLAKTDSPRHD